jgi:hypothetical protein
MMKKQQTIRKNILGLSKLTALLFIVLSSLSVKGQNSESVNWTNALNNPQSNFYELQANFNQYWQNKKVEKGKGYKAFKRWESHMQPRVFPSGNLSLPTYENFISWQQENESNRNGGSSAVLATSNWTQLGPVGKPGGCVQCTGAGRVNFVRFDPNNTNTMYVGAPDGGLWKTTNGGTSWTTNTDFLTIIGVSDLAIDPTNTNIMYLATGDIEGAKNSIGVLKSTNGGTTWNATGLTFNISDYYRIGKMLMHPTNSSILIVATNGGIFRTTNGGTSWTQTQCCNRFQDMEFKPGDPNTVYASGSGLWKSTDNGVSWVQITSGLPTTNVQRIALGVTAGNAAYVYALIGKASDQSFLGLYRSTNSGTSFTLRSSTPNLLGYETDGSDAGGQAFYDLSIAVSPTNPELVTVGGVNQWQSTNGGTNWTIKSYWFGGGANPPFVHADVHEINYLPGSGTTFFSCNDGGIFKTTNNGTSWTDISSNLAITQETKIGLSASDANIYVIGTQDNGTSKHTTGTWTNIFGGDGGECFIDYNHNNTIYISYVYADWHRSTDGGNSFTNITSGLPSNGADFYSTWHQDPVTASKLYCAGFPAFYRSTNQGTSWSALGTPQGSGNIVDFAVAPSNTSTIYAIKSNAISKSTNGGTSFVNITGTLPVANAALTNLCVSNTDPNKVWVTFSGYSAGDKVFKTTNGGTSWTNVSTGLPNLPMNTIVYKNNSANDEVYVGGDVGVYYRDNTLSSWALFNTNLPNVAVNDLEIYYPTNKLRAGTYGRGTWESDLNGTTGGGCGIPGNLSATGITTTSATLNWGAVANATSYTVRYRLSPSGTWTTTNSTTTSKTITGLVANTAYDFQVRAVCTTNGSYSSSFTFTTQSTSGCGIPSGLTATSITETTATINWGAVANAVKYTVQYRINGTTTWTSKSSTTTSKAITGLVAGTTYNYRVRAICTANGTYSPISNFTTTTPTSGCTGSDPYEPNDNVAAIITTNANHYPLISSSTDNDFFQVSTTAGKPYLKVLVDGLPADYDLYLYSTFTGSLLVYSNNAGTTAEQVIYNAPFNDTYTIYVLGYGGAYNSSLCYRLRASTNANPFRETDANDLTDQMETQMTLYPNPAIQQLNVSLLSDKDQITTINIIDMVGRIVFTTNEDLAEGENQIDLDLSNVPNGIYTVQATIGGTTCIQKLVVRK